MDLKKNQGTSEKQAMQVVITSRIAASAEKVMNNYLARANEEKAKVRGPRRLPTRTLRITTRKTPCGNGTNTWDTFEMKIYKRVIIIEAPSEQVKKITSITLEPLVDVSISVLD